MTYLNQPLDFSQSSSRCVWFKLIDSSTGEIYAGTDVSSLHLSSTADVDTFRRQVRLEEPTFLSHISPMRLQVYESMSSFNKRTLEDGKRAPLKLDSHLGSYGETLDNPVIVVVLTDTILTNPLRWVKATEDNETGN